MGLDEIPPLFLKDTAYAISKPLANIINCSLMSGVVPNDFKRARVVPVYKSSVAILITIDRLVCCLLYLKSLRNVYSRN